MRLRTPLFITPLLVCLASVASSASPATYDVTVNTSAISGSAGSLDFQFNPGPLVTQPASLQILNFTSNGTLSGSPTLTGDVSGALPSTLTFDNGTGFNDYFQGFTFGKTLVFKVTFSGPGPEFAGWCLNLEQYVCIQYVLRRSWDDPNADE